MKFRAFRRFLSVAAIVLCIFAVVAAFIPIETLPIIHILLFLSVIAVAVLEIIFWRCPHCRTYLWKLPLWHAQYCPYCGQYLEDDENEWYTDYERINYLQGTPTFFENGSADMFVVTYADGMRIHVGYDQEDSMFVITVLADDSDQAKGQPLATHRVFGKSQCLTAIQNVVHTWRDDKIG